MSFVAGIDLSSRAIDIVLLEESTNRAKWHRFELAGGLAWDRTLDVRRAMPVASFWDDVYLAAIETPFPDQKGVLRRVQGAVMARIPERVLVWEANASQWKRELGLKGKPSSVNMDEVAPDGDIHRLWNREERLVSGLDWQNARDAYCIALWARESNRTGLERAC